MKDIVAQDIQAVIPVYLEGKGNVTMIYTREGIVTVNSAIKTVIRKLCAHYRLDIRASNRYFGKLLSVKNIIPLPLAIDKIYIQLKVRVPIGKDDGAMGYFNIDSIKKIKGTKSKGIILLENGEEIQCLVTQETIRKDMGQGEIIRNLYENKEPTINETIEQYIASDSPATKSDIARIYLMMLEVVNKVKY